MGKRKPSIGWWISRTEHLDGVALKKGTGPTRLTFWEWLEITLAALTGRNICLKSQLGRATPTTTGEGADDGS